MRNVKTQAARDNPKRVARSLEDLNLLITPVPESTAVHHTVVATAEDVEFIDLPQSAANPAAAITPSVGDSSQPSESLSPVSQAILSLSSGDIDMNTDTTAAPTNNAAEAIVTDVKEVVKDVPTTTTTIAGQAVTVPVDSITGLMGNSSAPVPPAATTPAADAVQAAADAVQAAAASAPAAAATATATAASAAAPQATDLRARRAAAMAALEVGIRQESPLQAITATRDLASAVDESLIDLDARLRRLEAGGGTLSATLSLERDQRTMTERVTDAAKGAPAAVVTGAAIGLGAAVTAVAFAALRSALAAREQQPA